MKTPNEHLSGAAAFGNSGTSRPAGRAQRQGNNSGHADDMAQLEKIKRPKVRKQRPGPFNPRHKTNRV